MSSVQERLQLKRVPLDTWNIREQLCLASAVVRSGDQNWMSVSRTLKTIAEPNRPQDWYSQKSCAAQYGALLEHVETPKRKKRSTDSAVETPQESILKRLTQERIVEIQKTLAEMNQQYEKLKSEVDEIRDPSTSEERLQELWATVEANKRAKEREQAKRVAWLKEREEKRARAERTWRPPTQTNNTTPTSPSASPAAPSSPLLSSLLKSAPVVTTPQHITHPANVVETVSPSAGAPTLSMLLEQSNAQNNQQDSKHAAIEHIKSQLVQIEKRLKARTTTPPPVTIAPAVDIDDIEIKAEDVYAFRDIDIPIPPVTSIHKGTPRPPEKSPSKREDEPAPTDTTQETVQVEEIKEEPMAVETTADQIVESQNESVTNEPEESETNAPAPEEQQPEVKISFPEVKFPTPEIKVIQPEDQKIKEEVKEPEASPIQESKPEEEKVVEEIVEEVKEVSEPKPPSPLKPETEVRQEETVEVPLVEPVQETPPEEETQQDAEVEVEKEKEIIEEPPISEPEPVNITEEEQKPSEVTEEKVEEEKQSEVVSEVKEDTVEDNKKEDDLEDSIPLKEMIKEENTSFVMQDIKEKEEKQYVDDAHTETDDDTPMELSREEEKDGKKKRDYSRKKKSESRTCSGSESATEASAPESPSASDAERQHRLWKKSVMLVYSRLCAHKYASLFFRPITDDEAPNYSTVVKRPMDLTTIRKNIEAGTIRTTAEFQRDVLLMLTNALMYNSTEHSVYSMAKEMFEEAQSQLGMLVAAQAHAGLLPPTQRRKRRRETDAPTPNKRVF